MRWASAVSDQQSLEEAVEQCVSSVRSDLPGADLDLAVLFVSFHHAQGYDRVPALVQEALGARLLIGTVMVV